MKPFSIDLSILSILPVSFVKNSKMSKLTPQQEQHLIELKQEGARKFEEDKDMLFQKLKNISWKINNKSNIDDALDEIALQIRHRQKMCECYDVLPKPYCFEKIKIMSYIEKEIEEFKKYKQKYDDLFEK